MSARAFAIAVLGQLAVSDARSVEALASLLADPSVRSAAADELMRAGNAEPTLAILRRLAESELLDEAVDDAIVQAQALMRVGDLDGARPLLEAAALARSTTMVHSLLAKLERQAGRVEASAAHARRAINTKDADTALLQVADAHILAFELARAAGAKERAQASLDGALRVVLDARRRATQAGERSRVERVLGRILDFYGDRKGAASAFERAMQLAARDPSMMLCAPLFDAVGAALVFRDVTSARAGLRLGSAGRVDEEDMIYVGVWVLLLERALSVPTDGAAESALRVSTTRDRWTTKLAAWVMGELNDAELVALAYTPASRVEAAFYTALKQMGAGDPAAEDRLRGVARSPLIHLFEVQLAQQLTAPRVSFAIPDDIRLLRSGW